MSRQTDVVTIIWRLKRGNNMREPHLRLTIKSIVAILCTVCFLTMSIGSVSRAMAEDTWETWPAKTTLPPDLTPKPETDSFYSDKIEELAKKKLERTSSHPWWIAAGVAVVIGIAIAAGSSSGGGGDSTTTNPGHH